MTEVRENGAASGPGRLALYAYDDHGRRTSLTRGNGTLTSYTYDDVSRLSVLTQDLTGSTNDVTFGYGYNPASEIASNTRSNDAYSFTLANANVASTANGLNQLTAIGGASVTHDARGNVTAIGSTGYGYYAENRMSVATAISGGYLYFDPANRLSFIYDPADASGITARQYAGHELVLERTLGGAIRRRYVFGAGVDEPLVWYEGTGLTDRRWLHADERGSVIAASDGSGNLVGSVNRYDEAAGTGTYLSPIHPRAKALQIKQRRSGIGRDRGKRAPGDKGIKFLWHSQKKTYWRFLPSQFLSSCTSPRLETIDPGSFER